MVVTAVLTGEQHFDGNDVNCIIAIKVIIAICTELSQ